LFLFIAKKIEFLVRIIFESNVFGWLKGVPFSEVGVLQVRARLRDKLFCVNKSFLIIFLFVAIISTLMILLFFKRIIFLGDNSKSFS